MLDFYLILDCLVSYIFIAVLIWYHRRLLVISFEEFDVKNGEKGFIQRKRTIEFSLNRDSTESRERKKNPAEKCYPPQVRIEPRASDFNDLHATV